MSKIELRDLLNKKLATNANMPAVTNAQPTAAPRILQRSSVLPPRGPARMNRELRPRRRS